MKKLMTLFVAVALVPVFVSGAQASSTDFEAFTTGISVNGQEDWTVEDSWGNAAELFDESVIDDGTGNNVWQFSNVYTSTSYSNQPYSAPADQVAGETGAGLHNDFGPDHTNPFSPPQSSATAASKLFYASLDFKSATGAAQPDLAITLSAGASQSTVRMSWLSIQDTGAGFAVSFYDTSDGSNDWNYSEMASGVSYTAWHNLTMAIEFKDGVVDSLGDPYVEGVSDGVYGNDIVNIYLDGSLIHTGTTWESYYYTTTEGSYTPPTTQAVNSLLFRMSGTANDDNLGAGFYFDNVEVSNVPEPVTMSLLALGGIALIRRKRKA